MQWSKQLGNILKNTLSKTIKHGAGILHSRFPTLMTIPIWMAYLRHNDRSILLLN